MNKSEKEPSKRQINHKTDIRYDLKKPCADCPFRTDAKFHSGVFNDLENIGWHLEKGDFIHTCHKTDPRSDSPEGQAFKGPLQHCGGLLSMMAKDIELIGHPQMQAWNDGRWKAVEQDTKAPVFGSWREMIKHYIKGAKDEIRNRENSKDNDLRDR